MTAPDELLDGATIPWDFMIDDAKPTTRPVPTPRRTDEQERRRRLIAGGTWRRG